MALFDGLLHYWSFDEDSGTRLDSVGVAHLTPVNSPGVVAGMRGSALDLETASSQYLESSEVIDWRGDFTFSAWVRYESLPEVGTYFVLVHDGGVYEEQGCGLEIKMSFNNDLAVIYHHGLVDGLEYVITHASTMATLGTWDLLIVTHDAASKTISAVSFGDDGVIHRYQVAYEWDNDLITPSAFRVGVRRDGTQCWDGLADEMAVWDRVITDAEMYELFNSRVGQFYTVPADSGPGYGAGRVIAAESLLSITPADGANLVVPVRALYVGVSGDVKLVDMLGTTVTLVGLAAGVFHPVRAVKVFATDTTATDIVGVV